MRWGVLADVHGNVPALESALRLLSENGVERIACAGDLVGYGPHPNETVELIAQSGIDCVAGNHDLMAVGRLGYERADELARTTLEWTRGVLGADARAFLEALPGRADLPGLVLAHGSLDDPTEYVDTDAAAAGQIERAGAPLVILGHTHVPLAYGATRGRLLRGRAGTVDLVAGERHVLNPGSVGQARERRPLLRLLTIDTDAGRASFHAASYDHRRTRAALVERGLPPEAYHRKPTLRQHASRVKTALLAPP